jgi:hypothetical protein
MLAIMASCGFKQFMQVNILQEIDGFFAQLNAQVYKLREGFSDESSTIPLHPMRPVLPTRSPCR